MYFETYLGEATEDVTTDIADQLGCSDTLLRWALTKSNAAWASVVRAV